MLAWELQKSHRLLQFPFFSRINNGALCSEKIMEISFYRNGFKENRARIWQNNLLLDARGNADVLRSMSSFPMAKLHADLCGIGFAEAFVEAFRGFLAEVRDCSDNAEAKRAAGDILKRTSGANTQLPEISSREADVLGTAVVKPYLNESGGKCWFRYPILKEWQIKSAR